MTTDGFTTVDAVAAIALTGLLVAGIGPLFHAYVSDLPEALERNRDGMMFHHLSLDLGMSLETLSVPYWSAGPDIQWSADCLSISSLDESVSLIRNGHGVRLVDEKGARFYAFRAVPVWEPVDGPGFRPVGIRLTHEDGLRLNLHFPERALVALRDE